ncbi:MAG: ComEA family DNA-binding protein [Syntrophaceticus sp.]|nr:ComEA family DNA-binding protein [Syntrophaceticus sp.]MDD3315577.1 ComEA family DNA-binding protein [Syntrophaceticus sp.]MDD4782436.1 ComEA family DNA-binding protein [Syntrophaceticus sp.]
MWEIDRKVQLLIILIAAALLFAGGYKYATLLAASSASEVAITGQVHEPEDAEENQEADLWGVHVAGAVNKPGVYHLDSGARVEDAVQRAEPLADADLNALNLARRIVDGEKILVPKEGEVTTAPDGNGTEQGMPAAQGQPGGKININTASLEELDTLPGIGPAIAQRIIDHRTTHGPFRSSEDLQKVSGIGEKRYEQLKGLITV